MTALEQASREFVQAAHSEWPKSADYYRHHIRVGQIRGKPKQCEGCGTTDPTKRYEWASLTKNYADPMDYKRLCRRCHLRMDEVNKRLGISRRGSVRLDMQGERHHQAKLSVADVVLIRSQAAAGETFEALGKTFGLSDVHIGRIVHRVSWRHIP